MTRRRLPDNIPKRGLSVDEAAEYVGLSGPTFAAAVKAGLYPPALPLDSVGIERNVWDRAALDAALDRLSGLSAPLPNPAAAPAPDPVQEAKAQIQAAIDGRKAKIRHQAA